MCHLIQAINPRVNFHWCRLLVPGRIDLRSVLAALVVRVMAGIELTYQLPLLCRLLRADGVADILASRTADDFLVKLYDGQLREKVQRSCLLNQMKYADIKLNNKLAAELARELFRL